MRACRTVARLCLPLLAGSAVGLSGCASFDGHPEPVIKQKDLLSLVAKYPVDQAIADFYAPQTGMDPKSQRNKIIGIYMAAIDARYLQFRTDLSRQSKGSNFGLDLGVLGLSSAASIAGERTANVLSASSAALTGTRASLSKDVFFEQTLPTLLANIDAARTRVRTNILKRMQEPASSYSMPDALADLTAYEESAALDKAIQKSAADAGARVDAADKRFDATLTAISGPPEPGVVEARQAIKVRLAALVGDKAKMDAVAKALGVDSGPTPTDTLANIMILFASKSGTGDTGQMIGKIDAVLSPPVAAVGDGN